MSETGLTVYKHGNGYKLDIRIDGQQKSFTGKTIKEAVQKKDEYVETKGSGRSYFQSL